MRSQDPVAYWQSVDSKHVSGPMLLTPELFAAVSSSPAIFARKVDPEARGGARFLQQWDEWMSAKQLVEREGGGSIIAAGVGASHVLAAKKRLHSIGQQPIASTLLAEDKSLSMARVPPFQDVLFGANTMGAEVHTCQQLR